MVGGIRGHAQLHGRGAKPHGPLGQLRARMRVRAGAQYRPVSHPAPRRHIALLRDDKVVPTMDLVKDDPAVVHHGGAQHGHAAEETVAPHASEVRQERRALGNPVHRLPADLDAHGVQPCQADRALVQRHGDHLGAGKQLPEEPEAEVCPAVHGQISGLELPYKQRLHDQHHHEEHHVADQRAQRQRQNRPDKPQDLVEPKGHGHAGDQRDGAEHCRGKETEEAGRVSGPAAEHDLLVGAAGQQAA
mmetsp:Transcript_121879/g.339831  ORF Transcript_121879/g.339831 Transcript_121879/m.339831 type:complete len:246 (+) Transcript_121879:870-1607(+)